MEPREYWEQVRPQYSHWRSGISNWEVHGLSVAALLSRHWGERIPPSVLDWGCGGGAVSLGLLNAGVEEVVGVDISSVNLAEASRQIQSTGPQTGRFTPVLIREPEDLVDRGQVHGVVSTATFQHFLNKPYARRVLAVMRSLLKDGCVGLIQTRYDDGDERFRYDPEVPYEQNAITRCSWGLDEFSDELKQSGFDATLINTGEANHYAWYVCR